MNPSHKEAIIDLVKRIQMSRREPVRVEWVEAFIKGLGYDDPGRELRRLYESGYISRFGEGLYGTASTQRPNSLMKWL